MVVGGDGRRERGFQSTFPQGERRYSDLRCRTLSDFNPRTHKANDWKGDIPELMFEISIHVPTRGTTYHYIFGYKEYIFQSTFPQGGRRKPGINVLHTYYFNPRSHKGNDMG